MNPWHNAWNRSMEIATGAPQVISHRVGMMHPAAWSATTAAELQQMVVEKMEATAESWSVLLQAAFLPLPLPTTGHPMDLWSAAYAENMANHAAAVVGKALLPVSRCVTANVDRLNKA